MGNLWHLQPGGCRVCNLQGRAVRLEVDRGRMVPVRLQVQLVLLFYLGLMDRLDRLQMVPVAHRLVWSTKVTPKIPQ